MNLAPEFWMNHAPEAGMDLTPEASAIAPEVGMWRAG